MTPKEIPADGKVYVITVKDTANSEVKNVELRSKTKLKPEENPTGFFLDGLENVTGLTKEKVLYQSMSKKRVDEWGLQSGTDLSKACGFNTSIQIVESTTPRVWKDAQGKLNVQTPKRMGKDGAMVTINGKPIYRNAQISFTAAPDVTIKHNGTEIVANDENGDPIYNHNKDEVNKAIEIAAQRKNSKVTTADKITEVPANSELEPVM